MIKLGIALGGGGAKGLAHIAMLEVIDEFGLEPHLITGTSIGAIIGVLYASGYSGHEIREGINQILYLEEDNFLDTIIEKDLFKWFEYIDVDWSGKTFLKADTFLTDLMTEVKGETFEELKYPLKVVSSDFWKRDQVIFDSGDIKQAIHASMALPGIFLPAVINDRVYIDGGVVNPVPFDLLDDCNMTIAINVIGNRTESDELIPSFFESVFNSFQIMQSTILKHKLDTHPPDIYIAPEIADIRMLEFYKADSLYKQVEPAKDLLRNKIEHFLEEHHKP